MSKPVPAAKSPSSAKATEGKPREKAEVERVAKAMHKAYWGGRIAYVPWSTMKESTRESWRLCARAAIRALRPRKQKVRKG